MPNYQSICSGCGRIHRWTAEQAQVQQATGWNCTHCGGVVQVVEYELTADRVQSEDKPKKGMFCMLGALLGKKD